MEITGSVMQRRSHVNMIQNFPRSLKMDRGKVENRSGLRRIETWIFFLFLENMDAELKTKSDHPACYIITRL